MDKVESKFHWATVDDLPLPSRQTPQWMRSACVTDSGVTFVPAAVVGDENIVFLSATFDGASIVMFKDHCFVDSKWLAREFPDAADLCQKIETKLKEWIA